MKVGVLGAGSWGTTLADLLAKQGHQVSLWAYESEVVQAINTQHENPVFLSGCALHPALVASGDAAAVVDQAELVVSVAPSHVVRQVLGRVHDRIAPGTIVVSATKGLETGTLALMSDVVTDTLPLARLAVLSGPSFALEVARGQPTAVVAASADRDVAGVVQRAFTAPRFRVYSNDDVVGVELAGALKNVIAVAAGMLEGMGLGDNARAALLTRGLAEIARLGQVMGANPLTFAGLAGMGDLVLTACGQLSRNRALGVAMAQGASFEAYRAQHRTVAEGANASQAAVALARKHGVELPIAAQVSRVLFEGGSVQDALVQLMERAPKAEVWR
jgi:glycerol-3-phosphate dehydrogenase (NAD(P)+)